MITDPREIFALVQSGWRHIPVLVVGDVMLDQYLWGEVERISPEAPVPVVRACLRDEKPGGAANVAMNLAGLGASVTLVGFAGGDREQNVLETVLADHGIEPRLTSTAQIPTTTKLRVIAGKQQILRVDSEGGGTFAVDDYRRLSNSVLAALDDCAVVVLSDYAKNTLNEELCQTILREARRKRIPSLVDPKHPNYARYRGARLISPNRKELAAATAQPVSDLEQLLRSGQALLPALDIDAMALTLGEKGIAILRGDSRSYLPAVVRQVYDVSGAGDTVIAVLALATACNVSLEAAAGLANIAAGVVVSKVGTVPIRKEELLGAMAECVSPTMTEKVLSSGQVVERAAAWRSGGQRIVFTNGCFDILHVGHIRLLEEARHRGDRLIVGLNSDSSVRELKGPLRPIVGERERAQVLAALSAVDAVVVFSESTPLRLIEALRPDVLVKGGDYTEENVVGAREVRSWGGRLELIPLLEGISTTRLIASAASPVKVISNVFTA